MPRILWILLSLALFLSACQAPTPIASTMTLVPSSATATHTSTVTITPFPPTTTATPTPTHTPTSISTATATPQKPTPGFEVRTHPDNGLFVGDQVSFEVIAPPEIDLSADVLQISDGTTQLEAGFAPFGIGGRYQATLFWEWDTHGFEVGDQAIEFAIQPSGYTWTYTVTLGPVTELPPPEPLARWTHDESDCCLFYYITKTAAAREITTTLALADERAEHAVQALGIDFTEPIVVTLMPRVLGHGGFASHEMYISFLDRNYAGSNLEMVLHHEMVHILDQRLGGDLRPSLLVEGLAVYLTGGHYKPEPLGPRAATLLAPAERQDGLGLDRYLPLQPLADDFYKSQHEIGYIQAGALVEYMVNIWGWQAFSDFYRDIHPVDGGKQSAALDAALQSHFGLTLAQLEANYLDMLRQQEITPELVDDVRLTIQFYDTVRRYQQRLDSSAYFLTAWLPNGPLMRERGIVADLVRRPTSIENLALETLLVAADQAIDQGDYASAEDAITAINAVLDAMETGNPTPFEVHPLASAHFDITNLLQNSGYQVEKIDITTGNAQVSASQGWADLTFFEFTAMDGNWAFVSSQQ